MIMSNCFHLKDWKPASSVGRMSQNMCFYTNWQVFTFLIYLTLILRHPIGTLHFYKKITFTLHYTCWFPFFYATSYYMYSCEGRLRRPCTREIHSVSRTFKPIEHNYCKAAPAEVKFIKSLGLLNNLNRITSKSSREPLKGTPQGNLSASLSGDLKFQGTPQGNF